jgi:hypothetical protein
VEGVQDGDGFGQFVADRVGVTAELVQGCGFDAGGEFLSAFFEPVGVGLPGPARDKVQQPGMHYALRVAGVVHDPGDHAGSRRTGVGPDMLIDSQGVHSCQPADRCDQPGGLGLDGVPGRVPGDAELVRQSRDRRIEMLQAAGGPRDRPGSEFCPGTGQRVFLGEGGSRAVRIRAPPNSFGPQQPHRPAETGNVMEPDLSASMADSDDPAIRAPGEVITGLDVQKQSDSVRCDGADVGYLQHRAAHPHACGSAHRNKT